MSRPAFRERRYGDVIAAYGAFIGAGFPVTLDGNPEALQCASDTDRANWLIFKGACDDALKAGALSTDTAPIPIRAASNAIYAVTYGQATQIIEDMRAWGLQAQANLWRLKDLVTAAETGEALNAIDTTGGWP